MGIWFWCVSTILYHVHLSRAAQGESASRRLSTHRCGRFGSHTSGTEEWGFGFGVCQQFYTMYLSPGLRGGNRLAGGSLLTVAAILDRIQAELKSVDLVSVCFNN